jgi:hypothetical protein
MNKDPLNVPIERTERKHYHGGLAYRKAIRYSRRQVFLDPLIPLNRNLTMLVLRPAERTTGSSAFSGLTDMLDQRLNPILALSKT